MNCHNGEKYLSESLNSLRNQNYKNWELIFFDNFSKDNSKKIFSKLRDNRFKYFKSKKLLKLYYARKLAVQKCAGEYICFLDTDDTWKKNKLSFQINFIKKNKCKVLYNKFDILNTVNKKKYLNSNLDLPYGKITQSLLNDYRLGILSVILERKIFKKFNFNQNYSIIGDFDFFVRLSKKLEICSSNKSLAIYRNHSENLSNRRVDIYAEELKKWLKVNKIILRDYNLSKIKFLLFKLRIKKVLNLFKK